ncbi:MAG: glutamine amidotransferase, partial [Candidatus Binatia bacterium]
MTQLYFIGGIPWWALLLMLAAISALLVYQFLKLKERLSLGKASLLAGLRGCVYLSLFVLLFNPVLVEEESKTLRRPLTLVIDTSQSMGLPATQDQKGKSRLDLVREKLLEGKEPLIRTLERDFDLRLYQFSTDLEPIGPAALDRLAPQGKGTRLLETLRQAAKGTEPQGAIVLFSDGIANTERYVDESSALSLPVFTIGVGESQGFTDLRIADLSVPDFAFRGREVTFGFTVQAYGLAGKKVPLYFNQGRNLISTRSITIDRDPFEQAITLTYVPKEIGPQNFTVTIPPQPGEQITQNNHKEFRIDVKRDKIRILTLSGSPSWNYRFLRMALKQDPFIELVSFVFLRAPTDSVDVPENQLSLIPFPIDEIFLEELKNFDLVFFEDFSHRSYFNVLYLEKVRDFVSAGGGLAMLGGSRSFDSGGYQESPLSQLLPVELDGKGGYQTGTRLRPLLTPAGKAHPVTRLLPDVRGNEESWKKMPPLTTFNRVARPRGETLLSAAPDGASGGPPLLTVGKFGKGRTLALMSDDLWRWNFIAVGEKEGPHSYLKLIRQAVRWLTQEPSLEQVQILSTGATRGPGEKIEFRIRALKDDFTPALHAAVRLRVIGPEGERTPLEATPGTEEGEYMAEFTPVREGSYRLEAEADLSGKLLGSDKRNFLVAFPYGETEDGRPRPELLKRISELSKG